MSKTYILQKDLPDYKANERFTLEEDGIYYKAETPCKDRVYGRWPPEYVENNPTWFLPAEKIEITSDPFDTILIRRGNRGISVEFDKLFDLVQKYYNAPEKFEIKYTEQDMRECFRNSRRMKSPFHTSEFTWDSFDHYMSFVKQPKYKIPPQHE